MRQTTGDYDASEGSDMQVGGADILRLNILCLSKSVVHLGDTLCGMRIGSGVARQCHRAYY
jgi:hypothetical protein